MEANCTILCISVNIKLLRFLLKIIYNSELIQRGTTLVYIVEGTIITFSKRFQLYGVSDFVENILKIHLWI